MPARRALVGRQPAELSLAADAPLLREWAIVSDATDGAALLAGVERMRSNAAEPRQFEAVWSVEPDVVRQSTEAALAMAARLAPTLDVRPNLPPPAEPAAVLRTAMAVSARVIATLDSSD